VPDDRTPTETPSGMLRLGIEPCPACQGSGRSSVGEDCFYCEGTRRVTNARGDAWRAAHRDTDPVPE
jgi:hypothetical protein